MTLKAAFEVARLVLVDDVLLRQSIDHGSHLGQLVLELLGVRRGAVLPQCVPHGLVVIPVAETLGLIGADALEG